MKISYAITVCNELEEIKRLVPFLYKRKHPEDEICVLLDKPKASQSLLDILYWWSSNDWITLKESAFQGHFSDWKNEYAAECEGCTRKSECGGFFASGVKYRYSSHIKPFFEFCFLFIVSRKERSVFNVFVVIRC